MRVCYEEDLQQLMQLAQKGGFAQAHELAVARLADQPKNRQCVQIVCQLKEMLVRQKFQAGDKAATRALFCEGAVVGLNYREKQPADIIDFVKQQEIPCPCLIGDLPPAAGLEFDQLSHGHRRIDLIGTRHPRRDQFFGSLGRDAQDA